MQQYHSSGKFPFDGLLTLVIGTAIIAAILGGLIFLAERILNFYLFLVYPGVAAFIGGGIYGGLVTASKIRNGALAILGAVIAGLIVLITYHALNYSVTLRQDLRDDLDRRGITFNSQEEFDQVLDETLIEHTGQPGLIGAIIYTAQNGKGLQLQRTGRSSTIHLQDATLWIYWGLELVIIAGGFAFFGVGSARKPFDETVNSWYNGRVDVLGVVPWNNREPFFKAAKANDWQTVSQYVVNTEIPIPHIRIKVVHSKPESQQHYLHMDEVVYEGKNNNITTTIALDGIISETELQKIKAVLTPFEEDE